MKITIDKTKLLQGLIKVEPATGKGTIQLLSNILMEAKDDKISLSTTNLEISIQTILPCMVTSEGAITIYAKKMIELIRTLPEGDIQLELIDSILHITHTNSKIKTHHKIHGIPKDDFPEITIATNEPIEIAISDLKYGLNHICYAISHDEARYFLAGVYLEPDNGINLVATDGKRLAFDKLNISINESFASGVICPIHILNQLLKIPTDLSTIKILIDSNKISFQHDNTTYTSNLLDGKYPSYQQIIPKLDDYKKILIPAHPLLEAIQRVSHLLDSKYNRLRLVFEDNVLGLYAYHPDYGTSNDEIDIDYTKDKFEIVFNYQFIIDVLSRIDTDFSQFYFKHPEKSILIKTEPEGESFHMIMPMNLNTNQDEEKE